ncbi:MAG: ABC transporter permease [Candidatus Uhrbacteria bacterium]
MRSRDLLITSSESLRRNKSRSLLTILGVVIGIAAVILMLAIGQSAEGYILNQVADLGSDLIFIEPSSGNSAESGPPSPYIEQTLTLDDAKALEKTGYFLAVSPVLATSTAVSYAEESKFYQIYGVDENYPTIFSQEVKTGRFFDQSDIDAYARVAILGKSVAENLFGDQDPLGREIKIKKNSFRVIGVFGELGSQFFQNLDERISIPVTTAQRDILGVDYVSYIVSRAKDGDTVTAKEEAQFALRESHKLDNPNGDVNKDDFLVSTQSDAVEIIGAIGGVLSLLLASIAAISLLVGGIGIMNIMLVSVTERTKEIGLRKAVGATYREILNQFLVEAVMLTALGGLVGIILGIITSLGSAWIIGHFIDGWDPHVPWRGVVLGFMVSTIVGLVFGIYPARHAARLDPIEALRYE